MDIRCYSLQNTFSSITVEILFFISNERKIFFSRAINRVKSTVHYRPNHSDSTIMILLICTMLGLCILIFYRRVLRAKIRSLFYGRNGLHSSASNSNFNQRYPLLTSIVIDDSSALSKAYSTGKVSQLQPVSYNERLRSV